MSDCLLGLLFSFSLLLAGVFGADDVTVSVMMGDNVTLPIKPGEINERLQWKYNNSIIASFNLQKIYIPAEYPDERFRGRLNLDPNTGSLTINNITTEDTGEYQLEIKTSKTPDYKLFRTFSVTVNGE
nr:CD48 antigen-like [Misgurnus anguillicaudatus]